MNAHPGNKVRILKDAIYPLSDVGVEVRATKDSLGTIVSYEEYSAYVSDVVKDGFGSRPDQIADHLALVKSSMAAGTHYPIRFDEYVPLPEDEYASWEKDFSLILVSCQVGRIKVLPADSFEVF